MTVGSTWVGEWKDPLVCQSSDGDIVGRIIELLWIRVERGLFTIFVKIRAHRGEFLNEKAETWADEGWDLRTIYDGKGQACAQSLAGRRRE